MATYLITGASRGIGLELTKQLLEVPASQISKIFTLSRSAPSGSLQELIRSNPDRVVHVAASVDSEESVRAAAKQVESHLSGVGLDVLINNAGVTAFCPGGVKNMPTDQLAKVLDVNVYGVQRVITAFLPLLEAGKLKRVVSM